MSSAVNVFVHAIRKRMQKCFTQEVGHFGSLGPIPMIQPPFNSSCVNCSTVNMSLDEVFPSSGSRVTHCHFVSTRDS